MERGNERLLRVLSDVGGDLIANAEQKRFPASPWRRMLPAAACLLLAVGLGWMAAAHISNPQTAAPVPSTEAPPESVEVPAVETTPPETATPLPGAPDVEYTIEVSAAPEITAREQLVFWDTIYYAEALYTADEAAQRLGAELGQVTQADDETLIGAAVFGCTGAETRSDMKEREVPLEIFVENEQGYLYCLTYYDRSEPLMEWEQVYYFYEQDQMEKAVEQLLTMPEAARQLLELPLNTANGDWNAEELLAFFRATVQMETMFGTRTDDLNSYLWSWDGGYAVPVTDIRRQLDKYLEGYILIEEELPGYDQESQTVLLSNLNICGDTQAEEIRAVLQVVDELELGESWLDTEAKTLSVMLRCGDGAVRRYQLQWRDAKILYTAMETVGEE